MKKGKTQINAVRKPGFLIRIKQRGRVNYEVLPKEQERSFGCGNELTRPLKFTKAETGVLGRRTGFVLLFALLISSILLATGLGISRLMVRQITLASLSRESQVAFFAADSGMECAVHWNLFGKFDLTPIGASEPRSIYCNGYVIKDGLPSVIGATNLNCDAMGEPPSVNKINGDGLTKKNCFTFPLSNNPNLTANEIKKEACAFVVVDKTDPLTTKITSNGYNRCDLNAPNALQRTLELTLLNEYE